MICCFGLICAINIIWKLSLKPDSNMHLNKICTSNIGCEPIYNTSYDCKKLRIYCTGSRRCCFDCYNIRMKYISSLNPDNIEITPNVTIARYAFLDKFTAPIHICLTGVVIIFVLNIILFILYTLYRKYEKENCYNKIIWKIGANSCMFILFFCTMGFAVFNIIYILFNISDLYKCQPSLIMLMSTGIVLVLWFVEFINDIKLPTIQKVKQNDALKLKERFLNMIIKICMMPVLLFLHIFSRICLIWWIIIVIYLIGVIYDKWAI